MHEICAEAARFCNAGHKAQLLELEVIAKNLLDSKEIPPAAKEAAGCALEGLREAPSKWQGARPLLDDRNRPIYERCLSLLEQIQAR